MDRNNCTSQNIVFVACCVSVENTQEKIKALSQSSKVHHQKSPSELQELGRKLGFAANPCRKGHLSLEHAFLMASTQVHSEKLQKKSARAVQWLSAGFRRSWFLCRGRQSSPYRGDTTHFLWIYETPVHLQIREDYFWVCMTIEASRNVPDHNRMKR